MAGAKVMLPTAREHEYTDSTAANAHRHLHGAPRGRAPSTPTPTWCPSRWGAVYTDAYMEPLEVGRRLHQRLLGAFSRQGTVYIDTYMNSPPMRDGVHIKSTSTC
jgi:hypothetical protein